MGSVGVKGDEGKDKVGGKEGAGVLLAESVL